MSEEAETIVLTIGPYTFRSRLFLGTGLYPGAEVQQAAIEASETEVLTFAVRRLDVFSPHERDMFEAIDLEKFTLLPNTAGARTAEEAVRIARLAKSSGLCHMVKVEVFGDPRTLLPDPFETYKACEMLLDEGFIVLPYISDDVVLAQRLEKLGVHAVMPAGSPIGSGMGIANPLNLSLIVELVSVPVIVDAGIGSPVDVAEAMMLGADGVLLNRAVARAKDPVKMAEAMKHAVRAGRLGFEAGRIPKKRYASASSPMEGLFFE